MLRNRIRQTSGIKILTKTMTNRSGKVKSGYLALLSFIFALVILYKYFKDLEPLEEAPGEMPSWWSLSPLWSQDGLLQVNPHPYRFLNNNPEVCDQEAQTDILILVSSAVEHSEQRDAIRFTWGSRSHLDPFSSRIVFLLGQGKDKQSDINQEAKIYQDIIQEDFHDIYYNLTLKTVMGLKWSAIFCPKAKFVMKTDDDIFVNVPFLHQILFKEYNNSNKVLGCIKNGEGAPQPIPSGLQQQNVVFRPGHPEFVAGAGYVIPGHFTSELYLASLSTRFIPVEDAYVTGYCATKIGIHPPHHDTRFSCGQMVGDDCEMKSKLTGHRITPERQYAIFEKIHQSFNACGTRSEP